MNELIPFDFNENSGVRVVVIDGEPWFVAADVCGTLGVGRPQDSVRYLDDDEQGRCLVDTPSGSQEMLTVNEAGLYSLIIRSRKPEAKAFKRWITHEVLPSIRKTGSFALPQQPSPPPRELSRLELIDMARESEVGRLEAEKKLAVAAPKAEYVDSFVNGDSDATTIRVLANQLQIGEKVLRTILTANKAIYQKLEGRRWSETQNRPIPEYSWHAYATNKTWFIEHDQPDAPRFRNGQVRTTLYVTPIGKVKIRELLERVRAQEEQEDMS